MGASFASSFPPYDGQPEAGRLASASLGRFGHFVMVATLIARSLFHEEGVALRRATSVPSFLALLRTALVIPSRKQALLSGFLFFLALTRL